MNNIGRPRLGQVVEKIGRVNIKLPESILNTPEIVQLKKKGQLSKTIRKLLSDYIIKK